MPNGLLPAPRAGGRAPGRGAPEPPPGRLPGVGRGAPGAGGRVGLGLGVGGSTDGPAWAASRLAAWAARCDASCSAFKADARASAAATSMSCALAGFRAAGGAGTGLRRPAAFAGGAGFAATFGALLAAAGAAAGADEATIASRSRRATGASTVLDADLTYSPISWSFARTVLLSTPSSFASSCTRALPATALLTCEVVRGDPQRPQLSTRSLVISGASSRAHVGRPTLCIPGTASVAAPSVVRSCRYAATASVSVTPATRSARPNARRRTA